jgi:hypothetical protein
VWIKVCNVHSVQKTNEAVCPVRCSDWLDDSRLRSRAAGRTFDAVLVSEMVNFTYFTH